MAFNKKDRLANSEKLFAKQKIQESFNKNKFRVVKPKIKNTVNLILRDLGLNSDILTEDYKNKIYHAYHEYNQKYNAAKDFQNALEDFLFELYINKILNKNINNELINTIVERLKSTNWVAENQPMANKIVCAYQLYKFLETEKPDLTKPIEEEVRKKYALVFDIYSKDVRAYNNKIKAKELNNKIVKTNFLFCESEADYEDQKQNALPNSFIYLNKTENQQNKLLYINLANKKEELVDDITEISSEELTKAIKNQSISKLKNLLKDKFPVDYTLEITNEAIKESNWTNFFKAKLGAALSFRKGHRSPSELVRLKMQRKADIYGNDRLDNLEVASKICNDLSKIVATPLVHLNIKTGLEAPKTEAIKTRQDPAYVLHTNNGQICGIYFTYTDSYTDIKTSTEKHTLHCIRIPMQEDKLQKIGHDLLYINKFPIKNYNPNARVEELKRKYARPNKDEEPLDQDLIDFIIDNTEYLPQELVISKHEETLAITAKIKELREKLNTVQSDKIEKYQSILNTIERIAKLPATYFATSDSIISRQKCLKILDKLDNYTNLGTLDNDIKNEVREYFRKSYNLIIKNNIPGDQSLKRDAPDEPRFYFNPKTNDIAYVDSFKNVHRSKLSVSIYDSMFGSDKLQHVYGNKLEYTLTSEEVFKYITSKVAQDKKEEFKMYTVNEELEEIIADECASTAEVLKKLTLAAIYIGMVLMITIVPGFNMFHYLVASLLVQFAPHALERVSQNCYWDAFKNICFVAIIIGVIAAALMIPGINILTAGAIGFYITVATASLYALYSTSTATLAVSKHSSLREGTKELLNLKSQIQELVEENKNANKNTSPASTVVPPPNSP